MELNQTVIVTLDMPIYEVIGTKGGVTTVMDECQTRREAIDSWREYHHAFASDKVLAGKHDPDLDWHIDIRKTDRVVACLQCGTRRIVK